MAGMIVFVLIIVGGAFAFAMMSENSRAAAQRTLDDSQRAANAAKATFEQENRLIIDEKLAGWQSRTPAFEGDRDGYIAFSADRTNLAIYHCSNTRRHVDSDLRILPISLIRSVEIEATTKTGTKQHIDRVPVFTQQKKSAGGRALIGAIALGPVGAVVGAASGLNKKTTTTYREVTRTENTQIVGPKVLVISTFDPHHPVHQIRCRTDQQTVEWGHRIEALCNQ